MIMCFLCRKRKLKRKRKLNDIESEIYKYAFTGKDNKIKTEFLIKAMHDIADIFNSHHEKIYYHMNEFLELSSLAIDFVDNINNPKAKRSFS